MTKLSYFERGCRDLSVLLGMATLFTFLSSYIWWAELFCHPRWQYSVLALLLMIAWVYCKKTKTAIFCAVLALWHFSFLWPLLFGATTEANEEGLISKVFLYNVYSPNDRYDDVLQYIKEENPDFIVIEEVSPEWAKNLETLKKDYPFYKIVARSDNFGIALFSKKKGKIRSVMLSASEVSTLVYENDQMIMIGTHPVPPISGEYARWRNEQLLNLTDLAKQNNDKAVLLVGDLNLTPYSPYFTKILKDGELISSTTGQGNLMTWPTQMPFLGAPLDHVLHSKHYQTISRKTGKDLGSDHWPVIVELQKVN